MINTSVHYNYVISLPIVSGLAFPFNSFISIKGSSRKVLQNLNCEQILN